MISATSLVILLILAFLIYSVRFGEPIDDLGGESEVRSDFIWGILSIIPGIILGSIVGWFIVGILFNIMASFNPPIEGLVFAVPLLVLVFAGIVLLFSVMFMRLYYRLGLPQNIEIG